MAVWVGNETTATANSWCSWQFNSRRFQVCVPISSYMRQFMWNAVQLVCDEALLSHVSGCVLIEDLFFSSWRLEGIIGKLSINDAP